MRRRREGRARRATSGSAWTRSLPACRAVSSARVTAAAGAAHAALTPRTSVSARASALAVQHDALGVERLGRVAVRRAAAQREAVRRRAVQALRPRPDLELDRRRAVAARDEAARLVADP